MNDTLRIASNLLAPYHRELLAPDKANCILLERAAAEEKHHMSNSRLRLRVTAK